ncbi:hypothetical protein C8R44DRAFT_957962 [Mycena epipterygia]|nr:hypothetical protein C8R44DRAFT_957962 [Mycena epipterygia]
MSYYVRAVLDRTFHVAANVITIRLPHHCSPRDGEVQHLLPTSMLSTIQPPTTSSACTAATLPQPHASGGDIKEVYSNGVILNRMQDLGVDYDRNNEREGFDIVSLKDERWQTELGTAILTNVLKARTLQSLYEAERSASGSNSPEECVGVCVQTGCGSHLRRPPRQHFFECGLWHGHKYTVPIPVPPFALRSTFITGTYPESHVATVFILLCNPETASYLIICLVPPSVQ